MKFLFFLLEFSFLDVHFFKQDGWRFPQILKYELLITLNDEWKDWRNGWCTYFTENGFPTPNASMTMDMKSRFDEIQERLVKRANEQSGNEMEQNSDRFIYDFLELFIQKSKIGKRPEINYEIKVFVWDKPPAKVCFDQILIIFIVIFIIYIYIYIYFFFCVFLSIVSKSQAYCSC